VEETIFWSENATHRLTVTIAPDDATDFAAFAEYCGRLWRNEIDIYYVRAVVQAKCGTCDTWHDVGKDSLGCVVDTPDTATWQEVACNALHAAGLDLETFNLDQ